MIRVVIIALVIMLCGCAGKKKPDLISLNQQAAAAYEQGDYEKSVIIYKELIEQSSDNADLYFRLGNAYAQQSQVREAVLSYQEAVVRNPRLFKAWYNMGTLQLSEAGNSFTQLLQLMPPSDPLYDRVLLVTEQLVFGGEEESVEQEVTAGGE